MKKTRNLIVMVVIFLVLVAIFALWKINSTQSEDDNSESTTTTTSDSASETLLELDPEEIKSIYLENIDGKITLKKESIEEKSDDGKVNIVNNWSLEDPKYPNLDQNKVNSLASQLMRFNTIEDLGVKDKGDLGKYGFNDPTAKLVYTFASGDKEELILGGDARVTGTVCYYVYNNNNGKLALITANENNFFINELSLLKNKLFDLEYTDITNVLLKRSKDEYDIVMKGEQVKDKDGKAVSMAWEIQEPVVWSGYESIINTLVKEVLAIEVEKFFEFTYCGEYLSTYGLDSPKYSITLQSKDHPSKTLLIGGSTNDLSYGKFKDSPLMFSFKTSALSNIGTGFLDFFSPFVGLTHVEDVGKITLVTPSNTYESLVFYPTNEESKKADDGGFEKPKAVYTFDGRYANIKNEQEANIFSRYYQSLISPRIAGLELDAEFDKEAVDYSIKFEMRHDGKEDKFIEFVRRDEFTYYALLNGEYTGFYVKKDAFASEKSVTSPGVEYAIKQLQEEIEKQDTETVDLDRFNELKELQPAKTEK